MLQSMWLQRVGHDLATEQQKKWKNKIYAQEMIDPEINIQFKHISEIFTLEKFKHVQKVNNVKNSYIPNTQLILLATHGQFYFICALFYIVVVV